MIQRIQTLFLAGVVVMMLATLLFPVWEKNNGFFIKEGNQPVQVGEEASLNAWELTYVHNSKTEKKPVYYIGMLALVTAGIAGFAIFAYHNRRRQMLIGGINSLFIAATVSAMLIASNTGNSLFSPSVEGHFEPGFFTGCGAFLFNFLANRFIRRDEKLVQSADRLR